jgi:hypothetical protein
VPTPAAAVVRHRRAVLPLAHAVRVEHVPCTHNAPPR